MRVYVIKGSEDGNIAVTTNSNKAAECALNYVGRTAVPLTIRKLAKEIRDKQWVEIGETEEAESFTRFETFASIESFETL